MDAPDLSRNLSHSPDPINHEPLPFPDSADDKRFAIVPAQVVGALELTPNDVRAYAVLAMHANRRTRRCWPSIEALMRESAMPRRTLLRSLANLEDLGYIVRERRPNRVTRYVVLVGPCPDCSAALLPGEEQCSACGWYGGANLAPRSDTGGTRNIPMNRLGTRTTK